MSPTEPYLIADTFAVAKPLPIFALVSNSTGFCCGYNAPPEDTNPCDTIDFRVKVIGTS